MARSHVVGKRAWHWSEPGWIHWLALDLIVVCGTGTLLFNANPLLKFDGYHMLSDALETPNLQQHANRSLGQWWVQAVLG